MIQVQNLKKLKKIYEVTLVKSEAKLPVIEVSEDLVVEYRLVKDKILSEADYHNLLEDASIDGLTQSAFRLASLHPKSAKEIQTYLEKKMATEHQIERILLKLKKSRAIDDERVAKLLFEEMFEMKRWGPLRIEEVFQSKGFSEALWFQMQREMTYDRIEANLNRLFDKKIGSLKHQSVASAKRMMTAYLYQRGYSLERVRAFLANKSSQFETSVDETSALAEAFRKAKKRLKTQDPYLAKQKILASLIQKGFRYEEILRQFEGSDEYE